MSGYLDNAITEKGLVNADTPLIQKPFAPNVLARKVREVLEAST
jgi:hypothetical protein